MKSTGILNRRAALRLLAIICALVLCVQIYFPAAFAEKDPDPILESGELLLNFRYLPDTPEDITDAEEADAVREKVTDIVAQCRTALGTTAGEYDYALWMHDYLTNNAHYDHTLEQFQAYGVLILGYGVCQSYALAYHYLLDELGIENELLPSVELAHIWNLVKLEGSWYHVDCTWDDPGDSGAETHFYFCMNDDMIKRDHSWVYTDFADYPCTSTACYYPIKQGIACAASVEELAEVLRTKSLAKTESYEIYYTGGDADFSLFTEFSAWINENDWRYGIRGYGMNGFAYHATLNLSYTDPWDEPAAEVSSEGAATPFELSGPKGSYALESYSGNGVVLMFGDAGNEYTQTLLAALARRSETLREENIALLVCMNGCHEPADLAALMETYGNLDYVYWDASLMWTYVDEAGLSSVAYPFLVIFDGSGKLVYYSYGRVRNMDALLAKIDEFASDEALPEPEPIRYEQGTASSGSIQSIDTPIVNQLKAMLQSDGTLMFVSTILNSSGTFYSADAAVFEDWESHAALYEKMNMKLAAYLSGADEAAIARLKTDYPHVTFITTDTEDNYFFWSLLVAAGYSESSAYSQSYYMIDGAGNILRYTNGSTITPWNALHMVLESKTYASVPEELDTIGAEAYSNTDLRNIDLTGGRLKSIGSRAFAGCASLYIVRLPDSVETIAEDAFANDDKLVLWCNYGSAAWKYAADHDITCVTQ